MATRSRIAIENNDGSVESVYCHWDGYPSNNGKLLLENYNNEEKIRMLISLGGILSLEENIVPQTETHDFDNREDNCTTFYHRDRGEDLIIDKHYNVKDWQKNHNVRNGIIFGVMYVVFSKINR